MDSRTAAHVLGQIAAYLELRGESPFKCRAYESAGRSILALGAEDLGALYRSGELGKVSGLGPATLAVVRDLVETGESRYLDELREATPEGLLEMVRVPGLGPAKVHQLHQALGVETLQDLENAARDGRLASLPRWGAKTAERVLKGIAMLRERGTLVLFPHGFAEARRLVAMVREHPHVVQAEIAGSIRRRLEVVRDVDIVAACSAPPEEVAAAFARTGGVREVLGRGGGSVALRFVDGTRLDLHCVAPDAFAVAWWRATGSAEHETLVRERLARRGLTVRDDALHDASGARVDVPSEAALYQAAGLAWVEPELREARGEIEASSAGTLPSLVEPADIRGVLHCHSNYSDGKATIAEMAAAARARGWSYLGISDHSEAAFYAGGLSRAKVYAQHEEIEQVNATFSDFRVLKGIEADILADGRLDYDPELLDRFDYVIGSIHSRFAMDREAMTKRVLAALDVPQLTILAHPTGRLLLTREPYALDLDAVLEKAAAVGVVVELNADPHRLDLDWRDLMKAKAAGCTIEIGPDAHSVNSLDYMDTGLGIARKGWLERDDVLNTRSVDDVLAFARDRRKDARGRARARP